MKSNLQNNHNNWHQGVDELHCLPDGTNPVHVASWARLVARLDERRPNRRKKYFYMMAACATTLIILSGAYKYFGSNNNSSADKPVHENAIAPVVQKENANHETTGNTVTNRHEQTSKNSNTVFVHLHRNEQKHAMNDSINKIYSPVTYTDTKLNVQPDSGANLVTHPPEKRAMGIRHINDFADTLESSPGMTIRIKPILRFLPKARNETDEKSAVSIPVKEHIINKSPNNQN